MEENQEIYYHLDAFEGPLDLLLQLIEKAQIDITDVSLISIVDQYFEAVRNMQETDMEVEASFLIVAAQLMLIKSRALLPKPKKEESEDPAARILAALQEYKRMKDASKMLGEQLLAHAGSVVKDPEIFKDDIVTVASDRIERLEAAFRKIFRRSVQAAEDKDVKRSPERMLEHLLLHSENTIPVPVKILFIMRRLYCAGDMEAAAFFSLCQNRGELLSVFMALLELLHAGRVELRDFPDDVGGADADTLLLHLSRQHRGIMA